MPSSSQYTFSSQSAGLPSVANARELGGYVLPSGKKIRRSLLLRGGALNAASDDDMARLSGHFGVVRVFDFRTEGEVRNAPDRPLEGAANVWLPAIDPSTEGLSDRLLPKEAYRDLPSFLTLHAGEPLIQSVAARMYTDMVDNEYTQLQYASFLQIISSLDDGAVYWHCSQGKDRTGLGAAFLLAALGAPRELILEDYLISAEYYAAEVSALCSQIHARGGGEAEDAVVRTFVGVNADYFEAALDLIDDKYGSMSDYLSNQLLLSDTDIARLRARLLEP